MKRLEKGIIALILVIFAGTAIMAFTSGGQKAESSSDAFDTSEYRKAVKSTDNHHFKNLKVKLTGEKGKITGILPKSPTSISLLKQWKSKKIDLSFKASKKDGLLVSTQKVKLPTSKMQELTHAMTGEIGYDPASDKLLIFAGDKNYSQGFYPLGRLKRNGPSSVSLSASQEPLELSFTD
ncbi:cyclophilin-like fold protein [uncultured Lactobacillus sp.]|uniref:cyclophilin-like fold protein n=1 Tax=uncultured Lactobacillus sp. TaxID=153152 RepID=UPI0025D1942D|nr:cyclophilin-like fold protein [uncultured Lactobacillus sp.]